MMIPVRASAYGTVRWWRRRERSGARRLHPRVARPRGFTTTAWCRSSSGLGRACCWTRSGWRRETCCLTSRAARGRWPGWRPAWSGRAGGWPGHLLRTLAATAVAADVAALDEAGRHALAAAVEKAAAPLVEDGMVRSEAAAHLVIAAAW